jgi:hypothetical protein
VVRDLERREVDLRDRAGGRDDERPPSGRVERQARADDPGVGLLARFVDDASGQDPVDPDAAHRPLGVDDRKARRPDRPLAGDEEEHERIARASARPDARRGQLHVTDHAARDRVDDHELSLPAERHGGEQAIRAEPREASRAARIGRELHIASDAHRAGVDEPEPRAVAATDREE